MKCHSWTIEDDELLLKAIEECKPLFEHFKTQGHSYSEMNAWDAVAGRLLPDICVTGAACKRRLEVIKDRQEDGWKKTIDMVTQYDRELAETTFDGVAELLGNMDAFFEVIKRIEKDVSDLKKMWK